MNILFVERDPAPRRFVKDMLVRAGATLTEVGGATGLPAVAGQRVELALVEVEAGGEGLAAIFRLAGRDAAERPAIVAIATDAELAAASRAAGADEALVEPVAMTALFDVIARYLPAA